MFRRSFPHRPTAAHCGHRIAHLMGLGLPLLVAACAYDWDPLDPRLQEATQPDPGQGGTPAAAGTNPGGATGASGAPSTGGAAGGPSGGAAGSGTAGGGGQAGSSGAGAGGEPVGTAGAEDAGGASGTTSTAGSAGAAMAGSAGVPAGGGEAGGAGGEGLAGTAGSGTVGGAGGATGPEGGAGGTGGGTAGRGGAGRGAGNAGAGPAGGAAGGAGTDSGPGGGGATAGAAGAAGGPCTGVDEHLRAATGHCYWLVSTAADWNTALAACETWGGSLAAIDSVEENDWIQAILVGDTWIGGGDSDTEGTFVWTSGEAWGYVNWNTYQPDDWHKREDCVEILATGLWNDQDCDNDRAYLCER